VMTHEGMLLLPAVVDIRCCSITTCIAFWQCC